MGENIWINDVEANELINLKGCISIFGSDDGDYNEDEEEEEEEEEEEVQYSLCLKYHRDSNYIYLHYKDKDTRNSMLKIYADILNADEINKDSKIISL